MCSGETFTIAVVGLLFGPALAIWPYRLAKLEEILDSIGRKPAGRVEPADWKVALNRIAGVALAVAGVIAGGLCAL